MSILINGMKMPKNGYECPLCRDGMCLYPSDDSDGICLSFGCEEEERPNSCPLVEVQAQMPIKEFKYKIGTWIELDSCMTICSECGGLACGSNYCPNCGAFMKNTRNYDL